MSLSATTNLLHPLIGVSTDTVGIPIALAAGLLLFMAPGLLPVVPGYLSAVVGVAPADMQHAGARRVLVPSLLFIASFSSIFILLGLGATAIGSTLNDHKQTLEQVGGVVIVLMGVVFLATPFVDRLNFQWHSQSLLRLAGRGGPLIAGAAFAIAWTPCTSITLGAILTQAAVSSSAAHAALLLAFYSAGLAIPFLAIALAFERATNALAVVKRHFPIVIGVGGAVMIALGLLILTGEFTTLNSQANMLLRGTGLAVSNICLAAAHGPGLGRRRGGARGDQARRGPARDQGGASGRDRRVGAHRPRLRETPPALTNVLACHNLFPWQSKRRCVHLRSRIIQRRFLRWSHAAMSRSPPTPWLSVWASRRAPSRRCSRSSTSWASRPMSPTGACASPPMDGAWHWR